MHVRSGESGASAIPGERERQIITAVLHHYLPFITVIKLKRKTKPLKLKQQLECP